MNDEEIKKALECCAYNEDCESCPRSKYCDGVEQMIHALDLINRQQAEIERYEKESNEQFDKIKLLDDRIKQRYAELFEEAKEFVRTEAIKEFAERLKEKQRTFIGDGYAYEFIPSIEIDVLLAEMVGGENESVVSAR